MGNLPTPPWEAEPREPEQPVYHAECSRLYRQAVWWDGRAVEHKSPHPTCTCGFYASYDPDTDFYPSFRWGRAYARLAGAEGYEDFAIVKAAVEVSGTVVMGRLGVRAEKMKILGIALDWSKKFSEREAREYDWIYGRRRVDADSKDDARTVAEAHALAFGYGAEFYGSVEDLVKAHPKADVSALGVDTTPREKPDDHWTRLWANGFTRASVPPALTQQQILGAQKAMQRAAISLGEMRKALADALGVDVNATSTPKRKPGGTMPDHARRALEAKQNRKAPPGAGIDRRKRKL